MNDFMKRNLARWCGDETVISAWTARLLLVGAVIIYLVRYTRLGVRWVACGVTILALALVAYAAYNADAWSALTELWSLVFADTTSLRSGEGIAAFCHQVHKIAQQRRVPLLLFISLLYVILQSLCLPGTIVLNAMVGALVGTAIGLPLCTLLGTVGAMCCYLLSSLVGVRLVTLVDRRLLRGQGLPSLRARVNAFRDDLFAYLLFLRLTPLLPNWLINLASPTAGVPARTLAAATALGIIPQTYLAVRFGALARSSLQSARQGDIISPWDTLLLAVLGLSVQLVYLMRKRFSAYDRVTCATNINRVSATAKPGDLSVCGVPPAEHAYASNGDAETSVVMTTPRMSTPVAARRRRRPSAPSRRTPSRRGRGTNRS